MYEGEVEGLSRLHSTRRESMHHVDKVQRSLCAYVSHRTSLVFKITLHSQAVASTHFIQADQAQCQAVACIVARCMTGYKGVSAKCRAPAGPC